MEALLVFQVKMLLQAYCRNQSAVSGGRLLMTIFQFGTI